MAVRVPTTLATIKLRPSGGAAKVLKNTGCVAGAMMLGAYFLFFLVFDFCSQPELNDTTEKTHRKKVTYTVDNRSLASATKVHDHIAGEEDVRICWLVRAWSRFSLEVVPQEGPSLIDVCYEYHI